MIRWRVWCNVIVAFFGTMAGAHAQDLRLLDIARSYVALAEKSRAETQLWGRLGGGAVERESATLLGDQLRPFLEHVELEAVEFEAYRPRHWRLALSDGVVLESAMPAPFDAWMPDASPAAIVHARAEEDWARAKGAWIFVEATTAGSAASTNVRSEKLYQKAVQSGAAGFVFSLPTPPGVWRSVVPVDKFFALPDLIYPNHRRPIPCFSVDSADGARLAAVAGKTLTVSIGYEDATAQRGLNTVATLPGTGDEWVMIACHLDAFFGGANDDASGIAVMVGLAKALSAMDKSARHANFVFVGLSAHHDEGAGMQDFAAYDPARMARITTAILLEHLDMHPGDDLPVSAGTPPFNDRRMAYLGPKGWPAIEPKLLRLVQETGLMTAAPGITHECIADLLVVCDRVQPFCLMAAPPFYHTDHDTMDKLTEDGLRRAVEFHLRLLAEAEFIAASGR